MNQVLAEAVRKMIDAAAVSPVAADEQAIEFEAALIDQGVMTPEEAIEEITEIEVGDTSVTVVIDNGVTAIIDQSGDVTIVNNFDD